MLKVVTALVAMTLVALSFGAGFVSAHADQDRPIVLFLLKNACDQADKLEQQFPDAYVYCTNDSTVMLARSHLSEFEKMYHVVYINNAPSTWGITLEGYRYSIARSWEPEIRHELEHQYCKCFYTADGMHGSPQTGTISGVIVS